MAIAVIGDEDLVSAMRLAGVSRYHLISGENVAEEVRQALNGLIAEPDIGVIALAEDYVPYVEDLLKRVKEGRKSTPVIIEVPSKYGAGCVPFIPGRDVIPDGVEGSLKLLRQYQCLLEEPWCQGRW